MNYRYMVIYQKYNGDILYRALTSTPTYKIGQTTSMGWKVLDIQHMEKGKCFTTKEYDIKLNRKDKLNHILTVIHRVDILDILKFVLILSMLYYIFVK